jgi:nucleoside-diphosphate-sugar epimerase
LLTGATGLVGGHLLDRLLGALPAWRFVLVVRERHRLAPRFAQERVAVWTGDISRPDLGLGKSQWAAARSSVTEIVHCAAATRFDLPLEQARQVNAGGTENVLALAEACPRLAKFLHVSTAYVVGRTSGSIPEALVNQSPRFCNTYQHSKYEAEQLVASRARSVPTAIARLSSIMGDSRDGHVEQFNYVHQLLKLYPKWVLPVVPFDPDAIVDVVPTDWVADTLAWLLVNRFQAGAVYHLCSGTRGMTVKEMLDETTRVFAEHPEGTTLEHWPRMVSLADYEEFAERTQLQGSLLMRELVRTLGYFLPHLGIRQVFENQRTFALLAGSGIELPPIRPCYAAMVRWCLDTNWGKRCAKR